MPGELIGEERGKLPGLWVLPPERFGPRVEVMQASGKMLRLDAEVEKSIR